MKSTTKKAATKTKFITDADVEGPMTVYKRITKNDIKEVNAWVEAEKASIKKKAKPILL